jgi:hypothetical protein
MSETASHASTSQSNDYVLANPKMTRVASQRESFR